MSNLTITLWQILDLKDQPLIGIIVLALLLSVYLLLPRKNDSVPLIAHIPNRNEKRPPLLELLKEGYQKSKYNVFKLCCPHGEQWVLPVKFLDELKSLPENKISLAKSLSDQFLGPSTYVGTHDATVLKSISDDLARNVANIIQTMDEEAVYALSARIPECKAWTSLKVQPIMLSIIALLSGRVFVGPELGRNEEYQDCTVGYTLDSFNAANKIRAWHPILRPFIYRFVPEYRAVQRELATLTRLVTPLVHERLKGKQNGAPNMMDWNMNNSPSLKRHDVKYQAMQQLQVSFLAIHTTAKLLTNVCFDLAAHPEYLQLLRDELEEVLNTTGGQFSKAALLKLKKMDSIMSETQRHNPPGIMTFNRKATSSLELSNGLHIPSGTYLAAASSQIAMDSEHWDTPEKYDGLRFYRMRQEPGCGDKYQFVSTGTNMLLFGYGSHACPGRFFANNEVKIVLAHLIRSFDFALPDGKGRPKPITYDVAFKPDPNQEVLFKRRS